MCWSLLRWRRAAWHRAARGVSALAAHAALNRAHRVQAYELYTLGKQYIVRDGRVILIDENTGRLRDKTRWQEGLHQVWWRVLSSSATERAESLERLEVLILGSALNRTVRLSHLGGRVAPDSAA